MLERAAATELFGFWQRRLGPDLSAGEIVDQILGIIS